MLQREPSDFASARQLTALLSSGSARWAQQLQLPRHEVVLAMTAQYTDKPCFGPAAVGTALSSLLPLSSVRGVRLGPALPRAALGDPRLAELLHTAIRLMEVDPASWNVRALASACIGAAKLQGWRHRKLQPLVHRFFEAAAPLAVQLLYAAPTETDLTRAPVHLAWAFATVRQPAPELFDAIARVTAAVAHDLTPQGAANLAWSFATASQPAPALMDALLHALADAPSGWAPQSISMALWAAAKLGHKPPAAAIAAIAQHVYTTRADMPLLALVNIVWACARLGATHEPLLAHVEHTLLQSLPTLQDRHALLNGAAAIAMQPSAGSELPNAVLAAELEWAKARCSADQGWGAACGVKDGQTASVLPAASAQRAATPANAEHAWLPSVDQAPPLASVSGTASQPGSVFVQLPAQAGVSAGKPGQAAGSTHLGATALLVASFTPEPDVPSAMQLANCMFSPALASASNLRTLAAAAFGYVRLQPWHEQLEAEAEDRLQYDAAVQSPGGVWNAAVMALHTALFPGHDEARTAALAAALGAPDSQAIAEPDIEAHVRTSPVWKESSVLLHCARTAYAIGEAAVCENRARGLERVPGPVAEALRWHRGAPGAAVPSSAALPGLERHVMRALLQGAVAHVRAREMGAQHVLLLLWGAAQAGVWDRPAFEALLQFVWDAVRLEDVPEAQLADVLSAVPLSVRGPIALSDADELLAASPATAEKLQQAVRSSLERQPVPWLSGAAGSSHARSGANSSVRALRRQHAPARAHLLDSAFAQAALGPEHPRWMAERVDIDPALCVDDGTGAAVLPKAALAREPFQAGSTALLSQPAMQLNTRGLAQAMQAAMHERSQQSSAVDSFMRATAPHITSADSWLRQWLDADTRPSSEQHSLVAASMSVAPAAAEAKPDAARAGTPHAPPGMLRAASPATRARHASAWGSAQVLVRPGGRAEFQAPTAGITHTAASVEADGLLLMELWCALAYACPWPEVLRAAPPHVYSSMTRLQEALHAQGLSEMAFAAAKAEAAGASESRE